VKAWFREAAIFAQDLDQAAMGGADDPYPRNEKDNNKSRND
jgi:hypothetical protein